MKFANYVFNARGVNNLGDNMQIIAIDYIYNQMGIDLRDVVYIDVRELKTYNGEYVILPITMPLVDYQENGIAGRFSDRIIPVFLGLTLVKDSLETDEIDFYKKNEPIGCRDERTLNTMRKYGIVSYLHGCITTTLPKRNNSEYNDIFIVDVDEQFIDTIPDYLKNNAKYRTHLIKQQLDNPKKAALNQYCEYLDNAKLVITSRLHCAIPCLAAGIPVVLLKSLVSYRFAWLEKILPIYSLNNIGDIDWNPPVRLTEEHKKLVLNVTITRLKETYDRFQNMCDLSFFYEERNKNIYVVDACYSLISYIETNWTNKERSGNYSFWGLTQMSEYMYDYITKNYPNMILTNVYDSFRKIKFKNLETIHPDNIVNNIDEFVFVTASGALYTADAFFKKINKPKDTFCLLKVIK